MLCTAVALRLATKLVVRAIVSRIALQREKPVEKKHIERPISRCLSNCNRRIETTPILRSPLEREHRNRFVVGSLNPSLESISAS